jgi:hypothetical protein
MILGGEDIGQGLCSDCRTLVKEISDLIKDIQRKTLCLFHLGVHKKKALSLGKELVFP